jgi:hypothetical protein
MYRTIASAILAIIALGICGRALIIGNKTKKL